MTSLFMCSLRVQQ